MSFNSTARPSEAPKSISLRKSLGAASLPSLRPSPADATGHKLGLVSHTDSKGNAMDIEEVNTDQPSKSHFKAENTGDCGAKTCKCVRKRPMDVDQATSTIGPNKRPFDNESYADTYLAEHAEASISEPADLHRSSFPVDGQVGARHAFLNDIAELSRITHRKKLHKPGQKHNRPDGFTRRPGPSYDAIGRRDKMGTPVPFLSLTTPGEDDTPGTGKTYYLHDENQWPDIRDNNLSRWMNLDKRLVVTREDYERRGTELLAQRGCKAYADLLNGTAGANSLNSFSGRSYRKAGPAASTGRRKALWNLGRPKQVKLPSRGNQLIPYEEEDTPDV